MNILILSGSPRKGGNTDLLVEEFVKGAAQKHNVEIVSLHDCNVAPCMVLWRLSWVVTNR